MAVGTNLRQLIEQHRPKMLDLKYTDLAGRLRHITLPLSRLSDQVLGRGFGIDGSSVDGLGKVEASDLRIMPDLNTAVVDPFFAESTVSVMCDVVPAAGDSILELAPRGAARRAEEALRRSGVADESWWGPEPEFYLFDAVKFGTSPTDTYVRIDDGRGQDGYRPSGGRGYHVVSPADRYGDVRTEMTLTLEAMGIPVKYHHTENGVPGQSEIEPRPLPLVDSADAVMLTKYVVKNVAARYGLTATFMPKPLVGEAGNGMHVHQYLMSEGQPVFYDADGYAGLSETALFYVGGLLKKSHPLAALVAASTNSYRRLVPGFEAPTAVAFSQGNRTACVRIPAYATEPGQKRIEYRPPDPTANPYLAMAAMLCAGLWGIRNRIDPREEGYGPIEGNVYAIAAAEGTIEFLPSTLDQALDELEADHGFLLADGVFTPGLVAAWIAMKRRRECQRTAGCPHPAEFDLYYDC